ncbi:hypothetical protein OE88DRAFT_1668323 [Heliocybe sulcata]|uniref:Fungal-type protein kinase domain-containing protein n=1 Tax=Heliocybe sulcata TaxID=5364 RepID=A0A5C3MP44_9AGAM|nr:hypothetical protein OE88DRAFT_1668323 [Heliocybe sulcata]
MDSEGARLRGRTGTWQFVSCQLLINPRKIPALQDDLQSFFWTLLYTGLHLIPCSLSRMRLADMLKTVFDESRWDDGKGRTVGGREKYMVICNGTYILPDTLTGEPPIIFGPPATPLNDLVKPLWRLFWAWELCQIQMDESQELVHPTIKSNADKLLTSEAILQLFKDAYTNPDWSHKISDRKEGLVPEEGHGSSSKRAIAEESEQRRKTQRKSQIGDATSSRLGMMDK